MKHLLVILFILLLSCSQIYVSPHTKQGQAKIHSIKVHTPYYIQYLTINGSVPFSIKWNGNADKILIEVLYINRPTSPRRNFPLYQNFLVGNHYTVYRDVFDVYNLNQFDGYLSIYNRGDYKLKVTLLNQYWNPIRYSNFKVY